MCKCLEESGTEVVGGGGRHHDLPASVSILEIPLLTDIVQTENEE